VVLLIRIDWIWNYLYKMIVHPLKLRNKKRSELDGLSDDDCDPFESCVGSECDRSDQFWKWKVFTGGKHYKQKERQRISFKKIFK